MLSLAVFCTIQLKLHVCEDALTRKLQHNGIKDDMTTRFSVTRLRNKMMISKQSFSSRAIFIILAHNNSELSRGGHALVAKLALDANSRACCYTRVRSNKHFVFSFLFRSPFHLDLLVSIRTQRCQIGQNYYFFQF